MVGGPSKKVIQQIGSDTSSPMRRGYPHLEKLSFRGNIGIAIECGQTNRSIVKYDKGRSIVAMCR